MQNLRSPAVLDAYLRVNGRAASPHLDRLCGQFHAHTTLLYWFTDLDAALAEARRTRRPILSLRLLGRLDEELSCANSRFFRRLLYPEARINRLLRERFVLHWQTVRNVPKVTIDFGNGRRVQRTITGNSLHLVLDGNGRPIDALPGLFSPDVFYRLLTGERVALPPVAPSRAVAASEIAMSKHRVELPLLRAISTDLDGDTRRNLELHAKIREALARGSWTADELVAWIYRDLFLMPLDDAALGLDTPDPF
jgi:hypothetical protein